MINIENKNGKFVITDGKKEYASVTPVRGATDSFERLCDGAWRWTRRTDTPVTAMKMEITLAGGADFTMVPAVSYNGNGVSVPLRSGVMPARAYRTGRCS